MIKILSAVKKGTRYEGNTRVVDKGCGGIRRVLKGPRADGHGDQVTRRESVYGLGVDVEF